MHLAEREEQGPDPYLPTGHSEWTALRFIAESITVQFDLPLALDKEPRCPDRFEWRGRVYAVVHKLSEWRDYARRGRMARNMSASHSATASRRGSWGVGRFYFRVRTNEGLVFDLYYDRRPKGVEDRKGQWFLFRELQELEPPADG
jgi:hypothetical protein